MLTCCLDNLSLQENTRYWPVRPIPRRNFHDDNNMNDQHLSNQSVGGSNTTIGKYSHFKFTHFVSQIVINFFSS